MKEVDRLKILIVTSEMPSHIHATAKLAKICAQRGHEVVYAAPGMETLATIVLLTQGTSRISCVQAGFCHPIKNHMSERKAVDSESWTTLLSALMHPYPMAQGITETLCAPQDGMYLPLKKRIQQGEFDLVVPIHSVASTVCDAVESLPSAAKPPKVLILNSLPYDPGFHEDILKIHDTCIPALPHVTSYSSSPTPRNLPLVFKQFSWKFLDAVLRYIAWIRAGHKINEIRARRGLTSLSSGFITYFQRYPVLSFGGLDLYTDKNQNLPAHVTPIGFLNVPDHAEEQPVEELFSWLEEQNNGIVLVGFGTGTILSDQEAARLAGDLVSKVCQIPHCPKVLFALRSSEQTRLRRIFDQAIGSTPTSSSSTHLEYLEGALRIQDHVPQAALLKSGQVVLFVSHMGMGGFTEAVAGGVPLACYPSGCDQFYNTERAVRAGVGVRIPYGMKNVGDIVVQALQDNDLRTTCQEAATRMHEINGNQRALDSIEKLARGQHTADH